MKFQERYTRIKDGTAAKVVRKVSQVVGARSPITTTEDDNRKAFGKTYDKLFKDQSK